MSNKDVEIDAIVINDRVAQPANVKPGYTQLYTMTSGIYTMVSGSSPIGPFIDANLENTDLNNARLIEFYAEYDNPSASGVQTINWNNGQKQMSPMVASCTYTFTDPIGTCNVLLKLYQSANVPNTPTFPGNVKWEGGTEPTWSTTLSGTDLIALYFDGVDYYGNAGIGYE